MSAMKLYEFFERRAVGKKTILGDINGKNPNSANESLLMFELMELMFKRLEPSSSSYTGHSTCTKFPAKLIIFFFQQALGDGKGERRDRPWVYLKKLRVNIYIALKLVLIAHIPILR